MKLQIELHTTDHRGDHSTDVVVGIEPSESETVAALIARAQLMIVGDYLVIRRISVEAPTP
jgi:hypothetical protein